MADTSAPDSRLTEQDTRLFDGLVKEVIEIDELASAKPNQKAFLASRLARDRGELLESLSNPQESSSRTSGRSYDALLAEQKQLREGLARSRRFVRRGISSLSWTLALVALASSISVAAIEEFTLLQAILFVLGALGVTGVLIAMLRTSLPRLIERARQDNPQTASTEEVERLLSARRAERRDLLGRAIRERLRLLFREISGPSYSLTLPFTQTTGLAESRHPPFVPTQASDVLSGLLQTMPNGTIGLAGPRGAGKTTLMRRVCETQNYGEHDLPDMERKPLFGILLSAPVEFDAREFLLHLTAQLCWRVLAGGPITVQPTGGLRSDRRRRLRRWLPVALLVSESLIALGILVIAGVVKRPTSTVTVGAILILSGICVLVVPVVGMLQVRRFSAEDEAWSANAEGPGGPAISLRAKELLDSIKFQQTFTSGWSGGLKLPIGVEGARNWGTSRAASAQSFPEVAATLVDFLELLATEWRVIVGIDELDKMDSEETARRFLNEIKVVFGLTGCFFLISVSEDAMGSFERRGMPFRDVFDSALDEIVHVPNLDLAASGTMLAERVVGLPEQFVCLCHCLGAGLPRDVIRVARELIDLSDREPSLATAAQVLIEREIASKGKAAAVTLRRVQLEPELSDCLAWIQTISQSEMSAGVLLKHCESFSLQIGQSLTLTDGREKIDDERQQMLTLAFELVAFHYYSATVLELFDDALVEGRYRELTAAGEGCPMEQLTRSRQAFGLNARIAWEQVSSARAGAVLDTVDFPVL